MDFEESYDKFERFSDETWGKYAFSKEFLNKRITQEARLNMIRRALVCGKETADRIQRKYQSKDVWEIAEALNVKVEPAPFGRLEGRMLFALFTPPGLIQINDEITDPSAKKLILGHELFHYFEEQDSSIDTRQKQFTLWKLLGWKKKINITAVSEIAAMKFTKEINEFNISPFLLDIIFLSEYDRSIMENIYQKLERLEKE